MSTPKNTVPGALTLLHEPNPRDFGVDDEITVTGMLTVDVLAMIEVVLSLLAPLNCIKHFVSIHRAQPIQ